LVFFSTEVSFFFFIFKYILYDDQNRDKLQKKIINTEKKVFSDEKKRKPSYIVLIYLNVQVEIDCNDNFLCKTFYLFSEIMVTMGYNRKEVEASITQQKYDDK
jgi:hypothetical protein